ncbi:MAG: hypothetical protein Pars2KO_05140 [Parasphingorhabdus sp.]
MRFNRASGILKAAPLAIGMIFLPACQTVTAVKSPEEQTVRCDENSIAISCLLQAAEQAFTEIESDLDWISAAGEFAVALSENGQKDKARNFLTQAGERIGRIENPGAKIAAAAELGKAASTAKLPDIALAMVAMGNEEVAKLEDNAKKYDLIGKLTAVQASAGQTDDAIQKVLSFPQTTDNHAALKARSLREIAVAQAKAGNFDAAERTIAQITFGLTYYQSTVRSDVAALAFEAGDSKRALMLLRQAETVARAQDNGYFVAGALRDIGVVYVDNDMLERAMPFFADAKAGARGANSNQERARALSRIGTGLADCGLYDEAKSVFAEARDFAKNAKSDLSRHFSHYEIAGSAAFAGDFDTANKLAATLPETKFGSTSSLKAATQRDLAWGLAKHGRTSEARTLINSIIPARERIMSYSRVVRLLTDPKMQAFPRYL